MPSHTGRATARDRAGRRAPTVPRLEVMEGRQLLSTAPALPDLVGQAFQVPSGATWGQSVEVKGTVGNVGTAPVAIPFQVEIYASPSLQSSAGAVAIGTVTIPAGLQPGTSTNFDQQVTLPATPLAGSDASGSLYLGMAIDPANQVQESNEGNNYATGMGLDTALVTIAGASQTASLVGRGLQVSTVQSQWGGSFTLTEQIANVGNADAPATTALVVLTPSGSAPGGTSDATVGILHVPAIAAGQSASVTQAINLPASAPAGLSDGAFTLSIVQDDDYLTGPMYPHSANQGAGLDQAAIGITAGLSPHPAPSALPTLALTSVTTPTSAIQWGQNFQVNATVQNTGSAASGPVVVRFVLVGTDGALQGLFLGQTAIAGLASQASGTISQNLRLPAVPPAAINSQGVARIAVVLDPEHALDQGSRATNAAETGVVHLVSSASAQTTGTTPTTGQATGTTPATGTTAQTTSRAARRAARAAARHAPPAPHTITHNLKSFARQVEHGYKKVLKSLKL